MTIFKSRTSPGEAVEVARNPYPYPSFELPSGTVTVRTNGVKNPGVREAATGWAASSLGVMPDPSRVAGSDSPSGFWAESTATSDLTSQHGLQVGGASDDGVTVTPGETVYPSIWGKTTAAGDYGIRYAFYTAGGAIVGSAVNTSPQAFAANVPQRVEVGPLVVPPTAVRMMIRFCVLGWTAPSGTVLSVTSASTAPGDYFDGSTPAAGDFEYVWSGTENASTSIMRAKGLPDITNVSDARTIYRSQEWAAEGVYSARTVGVDDPVFSEAGYIILGTAGIPLSTLGFSDGETITVVVKLRMTAPQSGVLRLGARGLKHTLGSDYVPIAYAQAPNEAGVHEVRLTTTIVDAATDRIRFVHGADSTNDDIWWDMLTIVPGVYTGPPFTGSTAPHDHTGYGWADLPNQSASIQYESDFNLGDQWWVLDESDNVIAVRLWDGTGWNLDGIPITSKTQREILYGARTTTHRYELLSHDYTTGADSLIGYLDGVQNGTLTWSAAKSVKKGGNLTVIDLDTANPGMLRIRDLNLLTTRIRPVKVIDGLPEMPLGIYEMSATPESWSDTGRTYSVELLDKSTVLAQDEISETFTAPAGVPILTIVKDLIESAGELISIDASETGALANARVWEVGTSKLRIINDLLTVLNYNALWVDGPGNFRATPYVRPAARSIRYTVLNDESGQRLVRELVDGDEAIYSPDWTRDQDLYGIPNRVIAVQSGTGEDEPLVGVAENTDPDDRFSIPNRGVRARTLTNVDVPDGTSEEIEAALEAIAQRTLIAASSPQSVAEVTSLPIPIELLDAVRFAHGPAGLDARHTVQSVEIGLAFDSTMRLSLLRVVDV